jgi:uncharacterized protein (DUF1501 family)
MSLNRRDFLANSGLMIMAGAAGAMSTEQWLRGADLVHPTAAPAAASDDRTKATIVTIFLRGGADSLNAIVPYGDDMYYQYRPRIGVPIKAKRDKAVLKLDKKMGMDYWGINPYMESIKPLIDAGQFVPIVNAGSTDGTRSHFSAQDYMERAAPGDPHVTHGWLNRYLEATKKATDAPLRGICAMTLLPRALRGSYPVLAGANRTEQMDLFEELYSAKNLANQTARDEANMEKGSRLDDRPGDDKKRQLTSDYTRDVIAESGTNAVTRIKALEAAQATASDAEYPNGGLGRQLRTIAQVIKANVGLEVAQADLGGWDTHSDQGDVDGRHSKMLQHLTESLAAFHKDLGDRMNKVMVLVMTEFGRTAHENGAMGTDHGRGSMMLAMSNSLNGGKVYGTHNGMQDLDGGRFQPVHTDFRAVFAETLMKMFNFDPFKNDGFFPGWKPKSVDYLNFARPVKLV